VAKKKAAPKKTTGQLKTVLPSGKKDSSFFEQVYDVARQIPRGRVTSYGAIAAYLGAKMSARMVGWAMNGAFHIKPVIPAHRVVNRNGMLSGKMHFATPTRMEELLKKEKIKVEADTIVDFDKKFWDPAVELELDPLPPGRGFER
jgi:methylated-DNA-protein-cysteine methyltransferase-like protein